MRAASSERSVGACVSIRTMEEPAGTNRAVGKSSPGGSRRTMKCAAATSTAAKHATAKKSGAVTRDREGAE
jgi:hypothetical protein